MSESAAPPILSTHSAPPLNEILADMLDALNDYLPPAVAPLPDPNVAVVSITERSVGLGNRRGNETRGPFGVVALKGGRLDATVRFQLWAANPADADSALQTLQADLLEAQNDLWNAGFLAFAAEESSLAEHVSDLDAWRKTADYRVLYEYHYEDDEGAHSLIAQIPIDSYLEELGSLQHERMIVTDEMARWDNVAAPDLVVRGRGRQPYRVRGLYILAYLPDDWDGNEVTVTSSVGGTTQQQIFASVRMFRDAFALETATVELGGNAYEAGYLAFPHSGMDEPIVLGGGKDIFHIRYADERFLSENQNETDAVVYLRVLS
jgi:hypothetical protein